MVQFAEQNNVLRHEQFGSRLFKSAIDIAWKKVLTYKDARLTKTDLATFENDASSCYDRVIPEVALLACRRIGLPPECCTLLYKALGHMRYHISKAHGIDQAPIVGSDNSRIFGTGQGSGASPAIWLAMSEVLIQALKKTERGTSFVSKCKFIKHRRVIYAFVDDSTVWANQELGDMDYSPTQLHQRIQTTAQWWEKYLSLSGGTLNLKNVSFIF